MCQAQGGWMSAKPDRGLTPPSSPIEPVTPADLRTLHPPRQGSERRGCRRPGKTSVLCPPLHPAFSSGWVCGSFPERCRGEVWSERPRGPEAQRQDDPRGCDGASGQARSPQSLARLPSQMGIAKAPGPAALARAAHHFLPRLAWGGSDLPLALCPCRWTHRQVGRTGD